MQTPTLFPEMDKTQLETVVKQWAENLGFTTTLKDFNKPWGGYFYLDEKHITQFANEYFSDIAEELISQAQAGRKLTPKILIVAPNVKLSWQYHYRRSEEWCVLGENPVGVMLSSTDTPPEKPTIYQPGERITIGLSQRHRLVGLDNFGLVAEIWRHADISNPSNEEDIVRLQDDFGRQ